MPSRRGARVPEFSVLLPTRNGGPYLRTCIDSVVRNKDHDLELIVADNANTDETAAILDDFGGDGRVRVVHHAKPLSVTENWMSALEASRGRYVMTIGDDDYVLPAYFAAIADAVQKYDRPDCISYNGYSYVFPNSLPGSDASYFADPHFHFDADIPMGELPQRYRRRLVADMFRFVVRYPLNVQLTTYSREAVARVPPPFFRPPFPDHFAINSLLLTAPRFVHLPAKLVVIGLSPKSFGHFAYGGDQAIGMRYLGSDSQVPDELDGSELTNSMHAWLQLLKTTYPDELGAVEINRAAYVRRQVAFSALQMRQGAISLAELRRRGRQLSLADWFRLLGVVADRRAWTRVPRLLAVARRDRARQHWHGLRPIPGIKNIREFASWAGDDVPSDGPVLSPAEDN